MVIAAQQITHHFADVDVPFETQNQQQHDYLISMLVFLFILIFRFLSLHQSLPLDN